MAADEREYLVTHGGVALGLSLLDRLARLRDDLTSPHWIAIPLDLLHHDNPQVTKLVEPLVGKELFLKTSGSGEAFSAASTRGGNSSALRPRLRFASADDARPLVVRHLLKMGAGNVASAVLQTAVPLTTGVACIVHTQGGSVTIEFLQRGVRFLFEVQEGRIVYFESSDGSCRPPEFAGGGPEGLAGLHLWMAENLEFDVNTEGFYDGKAFTAIQLRPVPGDAPVDRSLGARVAEVGESRRARTTRFVWGAFDYVGPLAPLDGSVSTAEALVFPLSYRLPRADARLAAKRIARSDADTAAMVGALRPVDGPHAAWAHPRVLDGEPGRSPLIVDVRTGFKLAHEIALLPPPGGIRDRFRQMSAAFHSYEQLTLGEWHLISDGMRGAICPI
ncbi:MAG TPA: hypothetical protein VFM94_08555 [Solirubrobacterales bacterium]|nr:hypothetical protein [Solirubrobacterales bacterium]